MQALFDFANHGILPFVGRDRDVERIFSFCEASFDLQRLRAAIVVGEAGIGKSRLFEEALPRCERLRIVVIRAKLHPNSTTSLIPLIARSLWTLQEIRQLLRKEPEETPASVIGAIQRLARLRRVMLVIEDIHLLVGDSVGEFARMITALSDEPLMLLCSARPMELTARGVLEPHLTLELELHGLTPEAVDGLWKRLFGGIEEKELFERLCSKTMGNPLALRSALRSAVKTEEAIEPARQVRLRFDRTGFIGSLDRNVRLLAEGMAAHLRQEERLAASELATLGEVFSREAARSLLATEADRMIDSLTFKGIIVESTATVAPFTEKGSAWPVLSFTHSLLHHHLVEQQKLAPERLLKIVAAGYPLYSILPYKVIRESEELKAPVGDIADAVLRMRDTALRREESPDWQMGQTVWQTIDRLMELPLEELPYEEGLNLRLVVMEGRLSSMRRIDHTDEYGALCDTLLRATENVPESLAHRRLPALIHLYRHKARRSYEELHDVTEMTMETLKRWPALRLTDSYVHFLATEAATAANNGDDLMLRRAEQSMEQLLFNDEVPRALKDLARRTILPHLLNLFDTEEELQRRLRQIEELERDFGNDPRLKHRVLIQQGEILLGTFDPARAIPHAEEMIRMFREQGVVHAVHHFTISRLQARTFMGEETLDSLERKIAEHYATLPPSMFPVVDPFTSYRHAATAMMFGNFEVSSQIAGRYDIGWGSFTAEMRILHLLHEGHTVEWIARNGLEGASADYCHEFLTEALAEDPARAVEGALQVLAYPMLRHEIVIGYRAAIRLLQTRISPGEIEGSGRIDDAISAALKRALAWLADRRLFPLMRALLDDHGDYLDRSERARWKERAEELAEAFRIAHEEQGTAGTRRCRLTMLGKVEFIIPDADPILVRGLRMKAILGLLVADRLARKPLSKQEFYLLAAGDDARDFDLARKTVNMAIAAIRKLLPVDLILRHDDTISLDLDLLSVDLLDASAAVAEALAALRERSFARARSAVVTALDLAAGEVAFPSLYDTYFEAAREDFETRLRNAVVDVGRALLREGDTSGAEEVLERGYEWLPEDEEIGELLRNALVAADRRAEAEGIRLRTMIETAG